VRPDLGQVERIPAGARFPGGQLLASVITCISTLQRGKVAAGDRAIEQVALGVVRVFAGDAGRFRALRFLMPCRVLKCHLT
jgi:hypothetical protein